MAKPVAQISRAVPRSGSFITSAAGTGDQRRRDQQPERQLGVLGREPVVEPRQRQHEPIFISSEGWNWWIGPEVDPSLRAQRRVTVRGHHHQQAQG